MRKRDENCFLGVRSIFFLLVWRTDSHNSFDHKKKKQRDHELFYSSVPAGKGRKARGGNGASAPPLPSRPVSLPRQAHTKNALRVRSENPTHPHHLARASANNEERKGSCEKPTTHLATRLSAGGGITQPGSATSHLFPDTSSRSAQHLPSPSRTEAREGQEGRAHLERWRRRLRLSRRMRFLRHCVCGGKGGEERA